MTPLKLCCSYKRAVTQHQCTATLAFVKCNPHFPVLLCKIGSQQSLCHCRYTYEGLLLIQGCSDPPPMLCSTGFGKRHSPLSSVALQNSLKACVCHCKCNFLFIQVCSAPAPMHCITGFGRMHSPLSCAAMQNSLTACMCYCRYTYEDLLQIQLCIDPPAMHCNTGFGRMHSPLSSAALQHRLTTGTVSLQNYL